MSHEIRTPMNGMIGMIEVLETMDPAADKKSTIGIIRNSAFSLLRIIDDILDASKIEAGKLDIHNTRSELRPVIEGAVVTLQTMADDFKVQLRLYIDPDLPQWALIDSGRLRQVLLNVLSNAIKFSASDLISRCPEVFVHIEHIHGNHLQVTVEDNGIGMPTSVTDNLFKPFMQGETSTTRRVDGTGLGLAITSNLLQLMNGDIAIKSAAGVGTTVAITLKLKTVEKTNTLTSLAN